MDILLGVLLISAILVVSQFVLNTLFFPHALGRRPIRYARHSLLARQALQDIDRKYEELLRS